MDWPGVLRINNIIYRNNIYCSLDFLLLQGNVKCGNWYSIKQKSGVIVLGSSLPALMLASLVLNFFQIMEFIWDMECINSIVEHVVEAL